MYQHPYGSSRRRGATRRAWHRAFTGPVAAALLAGAVAVTTACTVDVPAIDSDPGSTEPDAAGVAEESPDGSQAGEAGEAEGGEGQEDTSGQDDGTGEQRAPLMFTLDLAGYVPYADRFAVHYTIDGTEDVHGFCGFSEESRCSSTQLYSFSIPAVPVGAGLAWRLTWVGSSEFSFGHTDGIQHDSARTVGYTCAYPRSAGGNPQPDCRPDLS